MATVLDSKVHPLSPALHRSGVILVAVAGSLSWTSVVSLSVFLGWQVYRRRPDSKSVNLLRSQYGALYAGVLLSDLIQSTSFVLGLSRLHPAPLSSPPASCVAQAAMLNAGDVGSATFNIAIAIHTSLTVVRRKKPPAAITAAMMAFSTIMMVVFTLLGPFTVQNSEDGPFYDDTGFWCWISSHYAAARLYFHYVWVFCAALVSLVAYFLVFSALYFRKRFPMSGNQEAAKRLDGFAKRMLLFPLVYLFNVLPIAVARCLSMTGRTIPWGVLLFAGTVLALNGFFNVCLYAYTHRFFDFNLSQRLSKVMPDVSARSAAFFSVPTLRASTSQLRSTDQDATFVRPAHLGRSVSFMDAEEKDISEKESRGVDAEM